MCERERERERNNANLRVILVIFLQKNMVRRCSFDWIIELRKREQCHQKLKLSNSGDTCKISLQYERTDWHILDDLN